MKKQIPNLLTGLNLFCGCIAIVMILHERFELAAGLVVAAAFFDLFDGMASRMLNAKGLFGKEFDSLADVVSFGVVPGMIMFMLFKRCDLSMMADNAPLIRGLQFFPFIITVFSAIRLAKFNLDSRQSDSFIGLPTPANTLLIISFPLILLNDTYGLGHLLLNPYFILGISALLSYLLIAEIPLFSLKFKNLLWKDNSYQYILLLVAAILLFLIKFAALPLIIFFYVFLSVVKNSSGKKLVQ